MNRVQILLCACMIAAANAVGQVTDPTAMKPKDYAGYCIQHLKTGALVVRLNFKTKAINALLQAGNSNGASEIRYQQELLNSTIIKAFRKNFKFCPVYFVSYDSSIALVQGRLTGMLLNDNLEPAPSLKLPSDFFLFAEYGMIENTIPPDKMNPDQETSTRGLMEDALVIRDKEMQLLHDPFPYYVHTGNWDSRVKKLNKKFDKFYQLSML